MKTFGQKILLAPILCFLLAQSACTKKNEVASVSIVLPKAISAGSSSLAKTKLTKSSVTSQSVSATSDDEPEWNTALNPTTGSEINCFAVFVGGPGLTGNSCAVTDNGTSRTIVFGPNIGFVPSGSTIRLDVPAGSDRVFHVVGLKSQTTAACSNYNGTSLDEDNLSEPFLIASQRANIPAGESSLAITAALDVNKKISTCDFVQGGGGTGGGVVISFGDRRDGTMIHTGPTPAYFDAGSDAYNTSFSGYSHTPYSGGVASTKVFSSHLRVTNVATSGETAGKLLTTPAFTANQFEVGDEVLWHVSGGNANPGPPDDPTLGACGGDLYLGKFGFAKIASVGAGGTQITLNRSISQTPSLIKNTHLAASTANGTGFCRIALTRVPNFEAINVAAGSTMSFVSTEYHSENGTGGILAMRARQLNVDGTLNVIAAAHGYSGGLGDTTAGGSVWGSAGAVGGQSFGSGGGTSLGYGGAGGAGGGEGGMMGTFGASTNLGGLPLAHGQSVPVTSIATGNEHTCGVTTNGTLRCFGSGLYGQLGAGLNLFPRMSPQLVDIYMSFKSVSAGYKHTCAIGTDDRAYCWGDGTNGNLGDGTSTSRYVPTVVPGGTTYSQISANGYHTCAITRDTKKLFCWGFNSTGQIGDGTTATQPSPVAIDSAVNYSSVSVGGSHTCALTETGQLKCWGANANNQLGDGSVNTSLIPITITPGTAYKRVSAGDLHTCAITASDQLRCWGFGTTGRLGVGDLANRNTPTAVTSGLTYREVAAGYQHTCAVTMTNQVQCFGDNTNGQLGDATFAGKINPTFINAGGTFSSVAAGQYHSCAITTSGNPMCWGLGSTGQLGNGFTNSVNSPNKVRTQSLSMPFADGKTFHGGGGGGGSAAINGGRGGGIVLIIAKEVSGSGTVQVVASGAGGIGGTRASGGGGGGVIGLMSRNLDIDTVNLFANGGAGASGSVESAGGGGGIIDIQVCSVYSPTTPSALVEGGPGASPSNRNGARGAAKTTDFTSLCTAE